MKGLKIHAGDEVKFDIIICENPHDTCYKLGTFGKLFRESCVLRKGDLQHLSFFIEDPAKRFKMNVYEINKIVVVESNYSFKHIELTLNELDQGKVDSVSTYD